MKIDGGLTFILFPVSQVFSGKVSSLMTVSREHDSKEQNQVFFIIVILRYTTFNDTIAMYAIGIEDIVTYHFNYCS